MILADKIVALRKQNGWSQEELAEKMNVSRQSISKWEGAQSVPDLNKIILLSQIFGVSTDYLVKDEIESSVVKEDTYEDNDLRTVTLEEANDFLSKNRKASIKTAVATVLCILSPVVLIFLAAFSETGSISEAAATGIGLGFLFVLIIVAVILFIYVGQTMADYEFLETEEFKLAYGVSGLAEDIIKKQKSKFTLAICVGTGLCIICPVPLIITAIMEASDIIIITMVDVLLIIVAIAVFIFIISSADKSACNKLLQKEEYSKEEKQISKKQDIISTVYWVTATAVYLGWSFISNEWDKTWIVWPVAGVLFAAVMGISRLIISQNKH